MDMSVYNVHTISLKGWGLQDNVATQVEKKLLFFFCLDVLQACRVQKRLSNQL